MPALLQKADIGITANGRTLFEFAHFNIPCISLAQNDREKIHTFAKKENGVVFLGEKKDFSNTDLLNNINKLIIDNNYRKKLSENMKISKHTYNTTM
jgi:spore coat polysaccharide biosynthesis predicted glycosyltransferase SpsG